MFHIYTDRVGLHEFLQIVNCDFSYQLFIPLTFIACIYGMNFQFMPELGWKWAYPTVWGVFLAIGITMLIFFKKKR